MYRKYYSYNDMPQIAKKESVPVVIEPSPPVHTAEKPQKQSGLIQDGKLFGRLANDDIILIIVIFILLADDCDDKLLLLALGFIFLSGLI